MYLRLFITTLLFIALSAPACKKGGSNTTGQFTGKVVVMACGTIVVDIAGATGTGGGATWVSGSTTYNNAIRVDNYCYVVQKGIQQGDTISFNTSKDNISPGKSCATPLCTFLGPGPSNATFITDVQKVSP
ncbi:hypothetical protein HQ865_19755 [Mucilaginibacter mali]|uniref:Lipoprotein n=1 Tax=Mucilaginibacter mali TaxID=2740462 RepID=A0A7D4QE55_9SPHI|nr:hypothetical protein [Mucilaginibacter mali]QKJ31904.1 hypothetical protein HQ865_19755 [Mucilaginibacter mali]